MGREDVALRIKGSAPDPVATLGERLHREFPTAWQVREEFWRSVAREALAFGREQLPTREEILGEWKMFLFTTHGNDGPWTIDPEHLVAMADALLARLKEGRTG